MPASTILVIDDEPNIRSLIAQQFRMDGHVVFEAASGPEGLTLVGANSVDVIILDMLMPGMHGLEFLSKLKEMDCDSESASVIVISGSLDDHLAKECRALGASDILYKPFRLAELKSVVKGVTDGNAQAA